MKKNLVEKPLKLKKSDKEGNTKHKSVSIHSHNVKDSDIGDTVGEDHLLRTVLQVIGI